MILSGHPAAEVAATSAWRSMLGTPLRMGKERPLSGQTRVPSSTWISRSAWWRRRIALPSTSAAPSAKSSASCGCSAARSSGNPAAEVAATSARQSRCAATPSTSTSRGPPRSRRRPSSCRRAPAEPPPLLSRICATHNHAGGLALTAASLVEPFLIAEQRDSTSEELQPRLIPEARLDVLVEHEEPGNIRPGDSGAPQWLSAQLLAMVDVPASADSVLSMLTYDGSLIGSSSWDVGWSLADVNQKQVENDVRSSLESNRKNVSADSVHPSILATSATRIAILGVSALTSNNERHINISPMPQRGDSLMVVGSPFGGHATAVTHFGVRDDTKRLREM